MALILYASELAACVGMNKYKSVEDAKQSAWRRWDPPSFRLASEHNPLAQKSPEEVRRRIEPVDEARHKLVGSREIAETLNKSLTADSSTADVKRVIENVRVKDVKEARESVVHVVNCKRGMQNEHKGIASYENSKRVKLHGKNTQFYKKCIGETSAGTKVYVGGRADGVTHDKVVEIKCRRNRLLSTLPIYEQVQAQAYLFLTNKPVVEVVQKYDGMTRSDEYVADTEFWAEVCDAALNFASELENLIDVESAL
ncbi:unnamed protein product [Pylaiella littoralis]